MRRIFGLFIMVATFTVPCMSQIDLVDDKIGIGVLDPAYDVHMKGNSYSLQNESGFELLSINSNGALRARSGYGYIDLTPKNTGWAHIYSDRPNFIFNKNVWSVTGGFSSYYNKDLTLRTGGVIRALFKYNTGHLGINTSTPYHLLDLGGSLGQKLALYQNHLGNDFYGFGISSGTVEIHAGALNASSVPAMVVKKNGGRVGIGKTNPESKLDVHAGTLSSSNGSSIDILNLRTTNPHNSQLKIWEKRNSAANNWGSASTRISKFTDVSEQSYIEFNSPGANGGLGFGIGPYELMFLNPAGHLQTDGELRSINSNQARYIHGAYGLIHRFDGFSYYMLPTAANNQYGGWNSLRPFRLDIASGNVALAGSAMWLTHNGRVAIGTTGGSQKLHVNGSITYSGSIYQASDKRLKSDISSFEYGLDEVLELNPVNFRYNGKVSDNKDLRVGVIAQELQKAAPKLVSTFDVTEEDENGKVIKSEEFLKIEDSAIKYMLINSIKEQQVLIDEQQSQLNEQSDLIMQQGELLQELKELIGGNGGVQQLESPILNSIEIALENSKESEQPYLAQNIPNPTQDATIIKYFVPESTHSATVRFFSLSGQILDEVEIDQTGQGEIKVDLEKMTSGNYMYALIIDGELIDTKTMAITK